MSAASPWAWSYKKWARRLIEDGWQDGEIAAYCHMTLEQVARIRERIETKETA